MGILLENLPKLTTIVTLTRLRMFVRNGYERFGRRSAEYLYSLRVR